MDRGASALDCAIEWCLRRPQRIAFEEYVQAVQESTERVRRLTQAIEQELLHWRWQPLVAALQACRGIQLIHAARIVAELGDAVAL